LIERDFQRRFGEQWMEMKLIRVPWIRCRADEVGAQNCDLEWRGKTFTVLAYSEREAREWWAGLGEAERNEALGMETGADVEQSSFF
jgi:hypothetical protein